MWESTLFEPAPGIRLRLIAGPGGIRTIELNPGEECRWRENPANPHIREAVRQLTQYFAGESATFDLPLEMGGTAFQQRVWRALMDIPYGETRSYAELARAVGAPKAVRAVGAANGRNPLPIVVPCHRVIGSGGALVGYGGGLALKKLLLDLEARHAARWRSATDQ